MMAKFNRKAVKDYAKQRIIIMMTFMAKNFSVDLKAIEFCWVIKIGNTLNNNPNLIVCWMDKLLVVE
jgi:hypothetical protein